MKILSLFIPTVAAISVCSTALLAQARTDAYGVPFIEVTGKAEIAVEPDLATISVDFTKLDKDLNAARKANEEGVAAMLRIAAKYALPSGDVRTNNISVSMKYLSIRDRQKPVYDEDGDEVGVREFQGYEVSRSVTIKLKRLEIFEELFNDILATKPTRIDDVKFETSRLIELRANAREMAMKAALDKARSMTSAIGQTVGKAIKITEGTSSDRYFANSNGMANATNVASSSPITSVVTSSKFGTFSVGSISVEASVTVVFELN